MYCSEDIERGSLFAFVHFYLVKGLNVLGQLKIQHQNRKKRLTVSSPLGKETSPSHISNLCFFFSELRQRNALPKVESPGAPLQRAISEPTLAESPSQSNQSGDSNKFNQSAIEPRKSNSLLNVSSSSAGQNYACI